jgi:hypothetical protein
MTVLNPSGAVAGASDVPLGVIGTFATSSEGSTLADVSLSLANVYSLTTGAQTANSAYYTQILVPNAITVYQLGVLNGGTVSGNFDLGIYNSSLTKVISTGSTVQAGVSAIQLVDISDTALSAGVYYLAFAADNITGLYQHSGVNILMTRASGCSQQASAFPLPATAVFAAQTVQFQPLVFGAIQGATI